MAEKKGHDEDEKELEVTELEESSLEGAAGGALEIDDVINNSQCNQGCR
jgi:hypothetical protein